MFLVLYRVTSSNCKDTLHIFHHLWNSYSYWQNCLANNIFDSFKIELNTVALLVRLPQDKRKNQISFQD